MDDLNIKNYIIADYDIINNGLDILLNDTEKQKISNIRGKISQKIKNNKKLKKEMESRDWESLVKILDKISLEKQYDSGLNDLWSVFKSRMYTKDKLQDLDKDLQQEILDFILELYKKNIFIMEVKCLKKYYHFYLKIYTCSLLHIQIIFSQIHYQKKKKKNALMNLITVPKKLEIN